MAFSLFLPICVINKENLVLSTCSESARLCLSLSSSRADQLFGTQMFYPWCQVVLLARIYLSYLWCGTDTWRPMYYISIIITLFFDLYLCSNAVFLAFIICARLDDLCKVSRRGAWNAITTGVIRYQSSSNSASQRMLVGPDSCSMQYCLVLTFRVRATLMLLNALLSGAN